MKTISNVTEESENATEEEAIASVWTEIKQTKQAKQKKPNLPRTSNLASSLTASQIGSDPSELSNEEAKLESDSGFRIPIA